MATPPKAASSKKPVTAAIETLAAEKPLADEAARVSVAGVSSTKPEKKSTLRGSVATPAKSEKAQKADKARKTKLVRDSFTIPKTEYVVLEALKQRAAKAGAPSKKSEVLRAGIKALANLPDEAFVAAMKAVPMVKTGRPAKN